jgi:DNA-binding MarR family transcriptional regulator
MQEIRTVFDPQDVETRTIEELGRTLSNVYRKQYERIGENLRPLGITSLHSVILVNLFRYPGLNQNQLVDLISIDKASVSRILRSLEPQGLIRKELDETDHRFYRVFLTALGEETVVKSLTIQVNIWKELLREVSQKDRLTMLHVLYRMQQNLHR